MGDLFGSEKTTTSTAEPFSGKQKQLYEQFQPYLYGRVMNPRTYNGQLYAGLNSAQQAAIGKLANYADNPMLAKFASGQMIDPMKNPYVKAQADIISRNASDTWQKQGGQINSMFNKNSFWSGSAHENALKNAAADVDKATSGAIADLYGNAYNTGVNQMLSAQNAQQTAANNLLSAGNAQYNVEDTALTRQYSAWLKEQGMSDEDINRYLQYLGLGKNPTTTTTEESSGLGGVTGSILGGWASTWGNACFIAGTKVSTPDGERNIEDIAVGDAVYSIGDDNRVCIETVVWAQEPVISPDDYVKLVTDVGHEATTTTTQPFITTTGEVMPNEAVGEEIFGYDGALIMVVDVVPVERKQPVYDLSTTGRNVYFANGLAAKGRVM